ncbi:MAG: T9SS type A sorting domain-containing protein [Bacteroidales bacterium]|nr:T9SS type A sorting domain-containing protein [Bacteroidales bacterium]
MKKIFIISAILFLITQSFSQTWEQKGLDITGSETYEQMGFTTALNETGDIMVSGRPYTDFGYSDGGSVMVFQYLLNQWVQLGQTIHGNYTYGYLGYSIDINALGNIIVAGAYGNNNARGEVKVYQYNNGQWEQMGQTLSGSYDSDELGYAVSINEDGTTIALSVAQENTSEILVGAVYIYEFDGATWNQKGNKITGVNAYDRSGNDISINGSGDVIIIATKGAETSNGNNSGNVKAFEWSGEAWVQKGTDIIGVHTGEYFGYSVDVDNLGETIVVGTVRNGQQYTDAGRVAVYKYINDNWIQVGQNLYGDYANDFFGHDVAISGDGNRIICSSDYYSQADNGKVSVFEINQDTIILSAEFIGDNSSDLFGTSVAISQNGNTISVGAVDYDGPQNEITSMGLVRVMELNQTSIPFEPSNQKISCYPNPAIQYVVIENLDAKYNYLAEWFDVSGRKISQTYVSCSNNKITVPSLGDSMYLLKVSRGFYSQEFKVIVGSKALK